MVMQRSQWEECVASVMASFSQSLAWEVPSRHLCHTHEICKSSALSLPVFVSHTFLKTVAMCLRGLGFVWGSRSPASSILHSHPQILDTKQPPSQEVGFDVVELELEI